MKENYLKQRLTKDNDAGNLINENSDYYKVFVLFVSVDSSYLEQESLY